MHLSKFVFNVLIEGHGLDFWYGSANLNDYLLGSGLVVFEAGFMPPGIY